MNKFVVAAILFFGVAILSGSVHGIGEQTNLKTTVGPEIMNTVITTYVAKVLGEGFHIDEYSTKASILWTIYTVNLTDINVAPITFDLSSTKIAMDGSKNLMTLTITGLKTKMTSKLYIKGGLIDSHGNFTVDLAANITLRINLNDKHGKSLFLVSATECDISFQTFDIAVDGEFTVKILGYITQILKIIVKPFIPKIIASSVQSALTGLYTTPLVIPYELNLKNYSWMISPVLNLGINMTIGEYLKIDSDNNLNIALVSYFYQPPNVHGPFDSRAVPYYGKLQNQSVGVVIGNNVLNSLFWVANAENFMGVSINNTLLPMAVLNTDNFEFLFPNFYNKYGPNKNITVNVTNVNHAVVPAIKYCSGGFINMTFQANVSFLVELKTGLEKAFVLEFDFELSLKPHISYSNLSLSVENIALMNGTLVYTNVGDLDVAEFTDLLNGTLRNIRPLINYYLAKMSFQIPYLQNGQLDIGDGYLMIAGKIALTNKVKQAIRAAINQIEPPRAKLVF